MSNIQSNKPVIGITIGDINSIGAEIIIKTFIDARMMEFCTPVIFASNKTINFYRKLMNENNFNYQSIKDFTRLNHKQVNVYNCWEEEVQITPGVLNETGGKYAARALEAAIQCLKDGYISGLVTAPIHKNNIQSANFNYTGHTPYLRDAFNARIARRYEGIRDYIVAHYRLNRRADTPYWRDNAANDALSDDLKAIITAWFTGQDLPALILERDLAGYYAPLSWGCLFAGYGTFPDAAKLAPVADRIDLPGLDDFLARCCRNFPDHAAALAAMQNQRAGDQA